jgi:hypothetical protein
MGADQKLGVELWGKIGAGIVAFDTASGSSLFYY